MVLGAELESKSMKYLIIGGFMAVFAVTSICALQAQRISDYLLDWTARAYGSSSALVRLQKWLVQKQFYVFSVRIVASVTTACMLAAMIYALVGEH